MLSPSEILGWLQIGRILPNLFKKYGCLLIVEDNADDIELLTIFLRQRNRKHDISRNAEEALAKLRSKKYGSVFLDIRLPGMNGWKLLEHISDEFPKTRVVILCGAPEDLVDMPRGFPFEVMIKPPTLHGVDKSIM